MIRSQHKKSFGAPALSPFRATAYLRSLAQTWGVSRLAQLGIRVNSRLTSTVARLVVNEAVIELNPTVAGLHLRKRREVICHEAAHFAVQQRHRKVLRPHGPEWAALVRQAGFEPKASRVRCGQPKLRRTTKRAFLHTCPVCHFSKRAARQTPRWRCPECRAIGLDGSLRVEREPG